MSEPAPSGRSAGTVLEPSNGGVRCTVLDDSTDREVLSTLAFAAQQPTKLTKQQYRDCASSSVKALDVCEQGSCAWSEAMTLHCVYDQSTGME